jgi:hypothetical protein
MLYVPAERVAAWSPVLETSSAMPTNKVFIVMDLNMAIPPVGEIILFSDHTTCFKQGLKKSEFLN